MAEASAAAPGVFHVKPLMEDQNLEETRVQAQEDLYLQTKRKIREESTLPKIFFSDEDLQGEPPHMGPLVITLMVANFLVDKIIVDTGSLCNIMYLYTFKKFGFTEDLKPPPTNKMVARSNGQVVQPKGVVTLPVHAGSKTVDTQFLVIDASSTYNVILGRSWIREMKAVASTYHRLLRFPNKDSTAIEDIRGEAFDSTKTVIWNLPMGVFELDKFAVGTETIAKEVEGINGKGATTIIGGGDSVAAVEKVGVAEKMSHISTGGDTP